MEGKFHFEQQNNNQKYIYAILALVAIAFLIYLFAIGFFENDNATIPQSNGTGNLDSSNADNTTQENTKSVSLEIQRKSYGIPLGVFDELPTSPSDFNRMVSLMQQRGYSNYSFFSSAYYLQPEFYPSFLPNGLSYWTAPSPSHYGVAGMGFFPSTQIINIERGKSTTARFFVHAAFGVQSFQGIKLSIVRPEKFSNINAKIISPTEMLITPTFPKFSDGWARAVDVRIDASENAVSGSYELKFKIVTPSPYKIEEWSKIANERYFSTSDAGAEISHTIAVNVK